MPIKYLWSNTTLLTYFLFALGFSFVFNWLFYRFASNLGIRDLNENDHMRWNKESKPSIGGISFYVVFLLSIFGYATIEKERANLVDYQILGITLAVTIGFLIGLADDAFNTNPILKLTGQFVCANLLIMSGIFISITPFYPINYFFTTIWVVGLMNSINLLDNMDGAAGAVSVCIILAAIVLVMLTGQYDNFFMIVLCGVLASLIAFLRFNIFPSKIFMGDTGSQFLGVFLAAISIIYFWGVRVDTGSYVQVKQFLIPALIFIVPLTDTATVFFWRIKRGQSPMIGGRDHITHHLFYLGFSERLVIVVLSLVSLISAGLAIWVVYMDKWYTWQIVFLIVYVIVVFALFQWMYIIARKHIPAPKEL